MRPLTLLSLFAFALLACTTTETVTEVAPAPSAMSAPPPAATAAPSPAPVPVLPVTLPAVATLPFAKSAVLTVSSGAEMDYDGALLEDTSTGHLAVVFDRFASQTAFLSELRIAELGAAGTFGASKSLGVSADATVAGPHVLAHGGDVFLYFMHGNAASNDMRLARTRFAGGTFAAPEDLTLADPAKGNYAWPCAVERGSSIVMAYDHYGVANQVALGDGKTFANNVELAQGVQGRVASFTDGTLANTIHNRNAANMIAYVRVSHDAITWTDAAPITTKTNVHDVTPFRRADGGVDIYFISDDTAPGFRIIRRPVHTDATLGPEEFVSASDAGAFTQPHPHRLHDGSIGIVFAVQVTSNVDTDTAFIRIAGDAPP